jgi:predicted DNA-binding protein YlxM (UPF0122 family)
MDNISAMLNDYIVESFDCSSVADEYTYQFGKSPEDIICEVESRQLILKLFPIVLDQLDYHDKEILYKWIIEKKSQATIAKEIGITQQAVYNRIDKIPSKINKKLFTIAYKLGVNDLNPEDIKIDYGSKHQHLTKTSIGFPWEHFSKVGCGGYWGKKNKKKTYKTKIECLMPEYLYNSLCTLCNNCTRKCNKEGKTIADVSKN